MDIFIPTPELALTFEVKAKIQGRVKPQVIDAQTKRVLFELPWHKNLILNSGLDMIGTNTADITGCINYAAAGYGTSSPAITDTILDSERTGDGIDVEAPARSNTYLTGASNCGTTHILGASLFTYRRTYDFSDQVAPQTYAEVGFSQNLNRDTDLFSRIKLAGSVGVNAGQQLRLIYDLSVSYTPVVATSYSPTITGWTTTGDHSLAHLSHRTLDTDGNGIFNGGDVLVPGRVTDAVTNDHRIWVSDIATAPDSFEGGAAPARWVGSKGSDYDYKDATLLAYSNGNYYREKQAIFDPSEANLTSGVSSVGIGNDSNAGSTQQGWVHVFDNPQTKANTHRLTLNFRLTWDRV